MRSLLSLRTEPTSKRSTRLPATARRSRMLQQFTNRIISDIHRRTLPHRQPRRVLSKQLENHATLIRNAHGSLGSVHHVSNTPRADIPARPFTTPRSRFPREPGTVGHPASRLVTLHTNISASVVHKRAAVQPPHSRVRSDAQCSGFGESARL